MPEKLMSAGPTENGHFGSDFGRGWPVTLSTNADVPGVSYRAPPEENAPSLTKPNVVPGIALSTGRRRPT